MPCAPGLGSVLSSPTPLPGPAIECSGARLDPLVPFVFLKGRWLPGESDLRALVSLDHCADHCATLGAAPTPRSWSGQAAQPGTGIVCAAELLLQWSERTQLTSGPPQSLPSMEPWSGQLWAHLPMPGCTHLGLVFLVSP